MSAPIPSGYLIDKAAKEADEAALLEKEESLEAIDATEKALFEGSLAVHDADGSTALEAPNELEKAANETDLTLTDLEKTLTEKQLKFAWNLAKLKVTGKGSLTQCARDAGYSEAAASKEGSLLAKHPVICQVALNRMPAENRLKLVKEKGPDFVLEKTVEVLQRAMQERPVKDKNGNPTGYYMYDGALAMRALEKLGNWMGMDKQKVEIGGDRDGEPVRVDTRQVQMEVITIADRIKSLSLKKNKDDAEDA